MGGGLSSFVRFSAPWLLIAVPAGETIKYLIISLASLLIILVIYDLAGRRAKSTRFLFGTKLPP
jgi:hypothetical protein